MAKGDKREAEDVGDLIQVDTGDCMKVKQVIDEAVVKAVLDRGYVENHTFGNIKLSLMAIACTFALGAQFYPVPFPQSRPVLAMCCAVYVACSLLLQLVVSFFEMDTIMVTKVTEENRRKLRIRTDFPRYQEMFTVTVEVFDTVNGAKPTTEAEDEFSVGEFFDVVGYFDEVGVCERIDRLLQKAETSKGGKISSEKKKNK